jgi:hypothetical protein
MASRHSPRYKAQLAGERSKRRKEEANVAATSAPPHSPAPGGSAKQPKPPVSKPAPEARALCGAITKRGANCKRRAGQGTDHQGTGSCLAHEAPKVLETLPEAYVPVRSSNSLYATGNEELDKNLNEIKSAGLIGDLTEEIVLLRACIKTIMDGNAPKNDEAEEGAHEKGVSEKDAAKKDAARKEKAEKDAVFYRDLLTPLVKALGDLESRYSRIQVERKGMVELDTAKLVFAHVADMIRKYVPESRQAACVAEIQSALIGMRDGLFSS